MAGPRGWFIKGSGLDSWHTVVDECHHVPAVSFERVLSEVRARYVTGLTTTPKCRDGQNPIIEMQLGPAPFIVDLRSQAAAQAFQHRLIVRKTDLDLSQAGADYPIQRVYQLLAADQVRNGVILTDIISALEEGRSPIVLTERKGHLDFRAEWLRGFTRHLVVLKGGFSAKRRREALAALEGIVAYPPWCSALLRRMGPCVSPISSSSTASGTGLPTIAPSCAQAA